MKCLDCWARTKKLVDWLAMIQVSRLFRISVLLAISLFLFGCDTLGYYRQAVAGHWSLYSQRVELQKLISSPDTTPEFKQRLQLVQQLRTFSIQELRLPDNDSYRYYVDLKRPYVVWTVVAAPELSLEPYQWCYLLAGCFAYQGYFDEAKARGKANEMAAAGWDTMTGGVRAYSTLGWLADPLLNTFVSDEQWQLAAILFHELAHQQVYARGDTAFNESFASTVERVGVSRWLNTRQQPELLQEYLTHSAREAAFTRMQQGYHARLQALYESSLSEAEKRQAKVSLLQELQELAYPAFRNKWNTTVYDNWMASDFNNAKLAMVAQYHQWIPAFEVLLKQQHDHLPAFYEAAARLADLSFDERQRALKDLLDLAGN